MLPRLTYKLEAEAPESSARAGILSTRRGEVRTPIFMPVGTQATVRGMQTEDLGDLGAQILLANTYHLLLRPGPEVFTKFGGIHNFMKWDGLVLTDSGGFQIFSLPNSRNIAEEGATFKSYIDGRDIALSPETSIGMQRAINSDIMMVLDECVPATSDYAHAQRAMNLTHRWALRSATARGESDQALFAIVQGACHESLRQESADFLRSHPFDGYAIGGLAVGETREEREHFTKFAADLLPQDKPRYLMGVGTPVDLLEAVHRGVDMFDCIMPSALAQQGTAFTQNGKIRLRRSVYKFDDGPLIHDCDCSTCQTYSRAYLHHLIKSNEGLGWRLIAQHNFHFYLNLMAQFRRDIFDGTFAAKYKERREKLALTDFEYPATPQIAAKPKVVRRALGNYEVLVRHDEDDARGFIRQIDSGEVMHPAACPNKEAKELYIDQSGIREMLKGTNDAPLVVWDVGLGAGHNAMAVVETFEGMNQDEDRQRPLHMVSFEVDLDSLKLALRYKNLFTHLRHAGPESILREARYQSKCQQLTWELVKGDFYSHLANVPSPDIVLFDPFSLKTDEECWEWEQLSQLANAMSDRQAVLVTYSSSTVVRASMLAAGFTVLAGQGIGSRPEATLALSLQEEAHPIREFAQPLGQRWLDRWQRSSAAMPTGLSAKDQVVFAEKIRNHPQFSCL